MNGSSWQRRIAYKPKIFHHHPHCCGGTRYFNLDKNLCFIIGTKDSYTITMSDPLINCKRCEERSAQWWERRNSIMKTDKRENEQIHRGGDKIHLLNSFAWDRNSKIELILTRVVKWEIQWRGVLSRNIPNNKWYNAASIKHPSSLCVYLDKQRSRFVGVYSQLLTGCT